MFWMGHKVIWECQNPYFFKLKECEEKQMKKLFKTIAVVLVLTSALIFPGCDEGEDFLALRRLLTRSRIKLHFYRILSGLYLSYKLCP
jgi:hypothetical protein